MIYLLIIKPLVIKPINCAKVIKIQKINEIMSVRLKFFTRKVNGFKAICVRNRTYWMLSASHQDDTFPFWISIPQYEQDLRKCPPNEFFMNLAKLSGQAGRSVFP